MSTATEAVKQADPGASVEANGSNSYPARVSVVAPSGDVLWSGEQRNLFRKYGKKRQQSIKEIADAVRQYVASRK